MAKQHNTIIIFEVCGWWFSAAVWWETCSLVNRVLVGRLVCSVMFLF